MVATEQEQPKRRRSRAAATKKPDNTEAQDAQPQASATDEAEQPNAPSADAGTNDQAQDQAQDQSQQQPQVVAGEVLSGEEASQAQQAAENPAAGLDLSRLLQEQISQAIQPLLKDFRQQLAQTVQHEVEHASEGESRGDAPQALSTPTPDIEFPEPTAGLPQPQSEEGGSQGEAQPRPQGETQSQEEAQGEMQPQGEAQPQNQAQTQGKAQSESQSTSAAGTEQEGQPAGAEAPATARESDGSEGTGQTEPQEGGTEEQPEQHGVLGLVKGAARPSFGSAVNLVERQAEHLLQAAIASAIGAILAESTRAAVERRAEAGIHLAIEKASASLGDNPTVRELRTQTETTLLAILRETLDAVYSDELRGQVQDHAQGASRELLQRNAGGAVGHLREVVQSLVQEILVVLRHQWNRLLRLLLKVILTALENEEPQIESKSKSKRTRKSVSAGTGENAES